MTYFGLYSWIVGKYGLSEIEKYEQLKTTHTGELMGWDAIADYHIMQKNLVSQPPTEKTEAKISETDEKNHDRIKMIFLEKYPATIDEFIADH